MPTIPKKLLPPYFSLKNIFLFLTVTSTVLLVSVFITLRFQHENAVLTQKQLTIALRDDINRHLETNFSETCRALTRQDAILELIENPDLQATQRATELLNSTREILGASLIYIMDKNGRVSASSFSETGETLFGFNYRFRPYFTEAMKGNDYMYVALGVTTGRRGIYFSSPIRDSLNQVQGVAVIKSGLEAIDRIIFKNAAIGPTAVLSADGIVFASSEDSWLFRAAKPLSQQKREEIIQSGQFARESLLPLPFNLEKNAVYLNKRKHLVQIQDINLPNWHVVTLVPQNSPLKTIIFVCLVFTIPAFIFSLKLKHYFNENRYKTEINKQNIHLRNLNNEMKKEIEERIQTETKLKQVSQQELQYRMLFEQSRDAITIVSASGRFLEANQAFLTMMECSKEDVLGMNPKDFWVDQKQRQNWLKLLKEQRSVIDYQSRHITSSGKVRDLTLTTNATTNRDGTTVYLTILRDITDKLEDERKLIAAKTEAEQANLAKSNFLANMSHEIRTPMNGIIGMTDIVLESSLNTNQRNYLKMVRSSADRLLDIINNILDFSKIEAGRLELEAIEFNIREKLTELTSLMAIKAQNNNVSLLLQISENIPQTIIGDPTRLMQILINLTNNAIKFSPNGEVTLKVKVLKTLPPAQIVLYFSVKDNGIGVPPEKQKTIFESFSQADASTTRQYGGTGLGLTISSQLCHLMNGEIGMKSEKNRGALFWFTASFIAPEKTQETGKQEHGRIIRSELTREEIFKDIRILLAEDDYINKTLATAILEKARFKVTAVSNGHEAVAEAARMPYDLILMDIQMPEMDGYEATRTIRQHEKETARHTPIIAMTAHAIKGDREKCLQAGMDDYVTKPINTTELYMAIERHLLYRVLVADEQLSSLELAGRIFTEMGWQVTLAENMTQFLWECRNSVFDLIVVDTAMPCFADGSIAAIIEKNKNILGRHVYILATTASTKSEVENACIAAGIDHVIEKPLTNEDITSYINSIKLRL
ncbi:MAG: response regulator [Desulfopila sp.]|jgi:PAS domain S-box-containing protein|nr:response regulator [Desulfopila sp.]